MADTVFTYNPDYTVHPGEYLEEVLESRGIKKNVFSKMIGMTPKHVSQIINGKQYLTADLAVSLERVLGISANIWNRLNADCQLFHAKAAEVTELQERRNWIRKFPVNDLVALKMISDAKNEGEVLGSLLKFLRISSPNQFNANYSFLGSVSFRKSKAFKEDKYHTAAWLRACEVTADSIVTPVFSVESFKEALSVIRGFMDKPIQEVRQALVNQCAKAGVSLVFVPEFKNTHLSGATKWIRQDRSMIALSLRFKSDDHFWFSFFHEAGHVLLHGKKEVFLETGDKTDSVMEKEADNFARAALIPEEKYQAFRKLDSLTEGSIRSFAKQITIPPGVVVGRLQWDEAIGFNKMNHLKVRLKF